MTTEVTPCSAELDSTGDLRIVVSVGIDESRTDDLSGSVDDRGEIGYYTCIERLRALVETRVAPLLELNAAVYFGGKNAVTRQAAVHVVRKRLRQCMHPE